jgi:hypothetical protein
MTVEWSVMSAVRLTGVWHSLDSLSSATNAIRLAFQVGSGTWGLKATDLENCFSVSMSQLKSCHTARVRAHVLNAKINNDENT